MLMTLATIISHTPIWVWALYALLLLLGFQRTRDSNVPLYRLLILPLVVTALAVSSSIAAGFSGLPAMLIGLAIGSALGWQLEREGATRRLADGRVQLRGEWLSFSLLVFVLVFRYATIVAALMNPVLGADQTWHLGTHGISAGLSGLFLGRTAARLRVYFRALTVASGWPHARRGARQSPQIGPPGRIATPQDLARDRGSPTCCDGVATGAASSNEI
jgi:hypothetical protein